MPEPTSAGIAIAAGASTAAAAAYLTVYGYQTGLRSDQLLAGLLGAIAAICLLNSVPSTGDTWRELLRTSRKRIAVVIGSALTAGYLAPLILLPIANVPREVMVGFAFAIGAGAQRVLRGAIENAENKARGGAGAAQITGERPHD